MSQKRVFWLLLTVGLIGSLTWLTVTDNPNIWPIRNMVIYHVLTRWWSIVGEPMSGPPGILQGQVRDSAGDPIAGAWVLLSRWDGTTYSHRSDEAGHYQIEEIPAGRYQPVASAPGYANRLLAELTIQAATVTTAEVRLSVAQPPEVPPGRNLSFSDATTLSCTQPLSRTAHRQTVTFDNAGQPNNLTLFYQPVTATTASELPGLLTIYPGPADSWDCASIALAAAGYSVVSVGPAYSFEVEQQLDELERLIDFLQVGQFPGTDGDRVALLGGSFSSIHVQRLIQRRQDVQAALLLGPPTDMFDLRWRFENGIFKPPFGLDQVMLAAGLPHHEMMRYWRYSGAYHVRADFPPLALLHSRTDEVVPFQQTELLATNLAAVGADHETHFFEGASHYLMAQGGDEDTLLVYRLSLDFLARQLAE